MEIPDFIKEDSVAKAIERNRAELARLEKISQDGEFVSIKEAEKILKIPPIEVDDVEEPCIPDIEGFVESVSISATINLGNYSNTKLEVSASSGEYARKVFREEIGPTIEMVQGIIKQVSANDEKGVHRSR